MSVCVFFFVFFSAALWTGGEDIFLRIGCLVAFLLFFGGWGKVLLWRDEMGGDSAHTHVSRKGCRHPPASCTSTSLSAM
jgi:hypothetical protein